MEETRERPVRRVGRPRDPDAERAIIETTLSMIGERGFEGVRMADIAKRAGVAKATMYRRWSSKTDLVVAALQSAPPLTSVDSGSLRTDLLELVRQFLGVSRAVPVVGLLAALAALAAERQKEPRIASVLDPFVADRMRPFTEAFQRAMARGEVDPDADLGMATAMLGGPIVMRLFFGGATDEPSVERLVDMVMLAVERR